MGETRNRHFPQIDKIGEYGFRFLETRTLNATFKIKETMFVMKSKEKKKKVDCNREVNVAFHKIIQFILKT